MRWTRYFSRKVSIFSRYRNWKLEFSWIFGVNRFFFCFATQVALTLNLSHASNSLNWSRFERKIPVNFLSLNHYNELMGRQQLQYNFPPDKSTAHTRNWFDVNTNRWLVWWLTFLQSTNLWTKNLGKIFRRTSVSPQTHTHTQQISNRQVNKFKFNRESIYTSLRKNFSVKATTKNQIDT